MKKMQISKAFKAIVIFALAILMLFSVNVYGVDAGKSGGDLISSGMMAGDEIKLQDWTYVRNSGVEKTGGVITFKHPFGPNQPFLSNYKAESSEEIEIAVKGSFEVDIERISGNKKFGFVYGIPRNDKTLTESSGTYLYFSALQGGYGFGISNYVKDAETPLKELSAIPSANSYKVDFTISNDGKLVVNLNGVRMYTSETANQTTVNGYLGFVSLGRSTENTNDVLIRLTDASVINEYYGKPQTPLISVANFDTGDYNANEWFVKGSGNKVVDGKLKMNGSSQNNGFINRFRYSNFELQFDISDVKNTVTYDSNGKPIIASHYVGISWGADATSAEGAIASYQSNTNFLYFDSSVNVIYKKDSEGNYLDKNGEIVKNPDGSAYKGDPYSNSNCVPDVDNPEFGKRTGDTYLYFMVNHAYVITGLKVPQKYSFFSDDDGTETDANATVIKNNNVRISVKVVDGVLTVGMKNPDEVAFTTIYTYVYNNNICPDGYVSIRTEGNEFVWTRTYYTHRTYMTLDNIMLFNLDNNPNIISVEYKTNKKTPIPDAEYNDPYTDDYLLSNTGGKGLGR